MPVYTLRCPDCSHVFVSLVLQGTRLPDEWVCSQCDSRQAAPEPGHVPKPHPWESPHGSGCPCCGL